MHRVFSVFVVTCCVISLNHADNQTQQMTITQSQSQQVGQMPECSQGVNWMCFGTAQDSDQYCKKIGWTFTYYANGCYCCRSTSNSNISVAVSPTFLLISLIFARILAAVFRS